MLGYLTLTNPKERNTLNQEAQLVLGVTSEPRGQKPRQADAAATLRAATVATCPPGATDVTAPHAQWAPARTPAAAPRSPGVTLKVLFERLVKLKL